MGRRTQLFYGRNETPIPVHVQRRHVKLALPQRRKMRF